MKILYGIQGTGNGHISRAMEILPHLQKRGDVDVLISGTHSELSLSFPLTYQCQGLGFVFGKNGGIDLIETYRKSKLRAFYKEVNGLPVNDYDLVISDFEPVTAWACLHNQKHCVGLSNQVSLLSPGVPKAKSEDFVGRFILRNYAPCAINFGLSYSAFAPQVYTPIIRQSLRQKLVSNAGHYTVYLPSYADHKIIKVLSQVEHVQWHVFSKYAKEDYHAGNLRIYRLDKEAFERSISSAAGVVSAAGFGTTTEALFMGKKLLVIPQKNQYEQACNAEALKLIGVKVLKSLKRKHSEAIANWVNNETPIKIDYPDRCEELVDDIIFASHHAEDAYTQYLLHEQYAVTTA